MCRPKRFLHATRWRENLSSGENRAEEGESGGDGGAGGRVRGVGGKSLGNEER